MIMNSIYSFLFVVVLQIECIKAFSSLSNSFLSKTRTHCNHEIKMNINNNNNNNNNNRFVLSDYVQSTLLARSQNTLKSSPILIELKDDLIEINKSSYLVLLDLSVRTYDDLQAYKSPLIPKLIGKLKASGQDISGDKFLYHHDIGSSDSIVNIAIARIPIEMYQKLELSKSVISSGCGSTDLLQVVMLSQFGERILDDSMAEAVVSAYQSLRFKMPSLKSTSTTNKKKTNSNKKEIETSSSGIVNFVRSSGLPEELANAVKLAQQTSSSSPSTTTTTTTTTMTTNINTSLNSEIVNNNYDDNDDDDDDLTLEEILIKQRKAKALADGIASEENSINVSITDTNTNTNTDDDNRNINTDPDKIKEYELLRKLTCAISTNEGTNLARALSSLPPNLLNPGTFCNVIKLIAKSASNCHQLNIQNNNDDDDDDDDDDDNDNDSTSVTTTVSGLKQNWEYSEWTSEELMDMGCGAFYAVTRGNPMKQDRLVRLKVSVTPHNDDDNSNNNFQSTAMILSDLYNQNNIKGKSGGKDDNRPLVIVGKGVTYDTGGVNIKSANSMKTMKHDMGGAAAALGMVWALANTGYSRPIEVWLAIAENNIDHNAYRPDDVVTAITGDTIEVVHTDAEGRMLLADTLAIASRKAHIPSIHGSELSSTLSPKLMIDAATLTGTCISSLSNRYIGTFTNRPNLVNDIITAGSTSGERLWPFPCDDDYAEDLKSDIADVLQCRQPTEADHIYATSFLKRFVSPSVSWIHLDLGSAYRSGGLGHIGTDYTGAGVRSGVELIRNMT